MRNKTSVVAWVVAVIVVVLIVAGAWFLREGRQAPARKTPAATSTAAAPTTMPTIEHPIAHATSAPAAASSVPLPMLGQSDDEVAAALAHLAGDAAVGKMLADAHIIQRIVATIDALPRHKLGRNVLPLHPPSGALATRNVGGQLMLAPANHARYGAYMQWVRDVDVTQLVGWYVRYYPLFQQAYRKLGYPHGYFNDRLVAVIDHLLKAPVPQGPLALVRTDKGYAFADPRLESLSVGQKLMLRVGPGNEKLIKQKLQAIRAGVTGRHGPTSAASVR